VLGLLLFSCVVAPMWHPSTWLLRIQRLEESLKLLWWACPAFSSSCSCPHCSLWELPLLTGQLVWLVTRSWLHCAVARHVCCLLLCCVLASLSLPLQHYSYSNAIRMLIRSASLQWPCSVGCWPRQ